MARRGLSGVVAHCRICAVFKSKNPAADVASHRPVFLTSAACNVTAAIALARIPEKADWILRYQFTSSISDSVNSSEDD